MFLGVPLKVLLVLREALVADLRERHALDVVRIGLSCGTNWACATRGARRTSCSRGRCCAEAKVEAELRRARGKARRVGQPDEGVVDDEEAVGAPQPVVPRYAVRTARLRYVQ
eukprot:scaffold21866_cov69-Phaeocystis_antarctica.AAC.4